jgi:hypothetical protein
MSKCHVRELAKVYQHLLADASYAFPTLVTEFEKDLTRLQVLIERRGLPVFLVDLPAVGKHLDRCLANGEYKLSGLPLTKRFSNRVVIPKLFRGLYLLIFDENGRLKESCNSEAIFFLRQLCYAAKKTRYDCSPDKVEDEVLKLIETDAQLPVPEGYWNAADPLSLSAPAPYQGFGRSPQLKERVDRVACPRRAAKVSTFLAKLDTVSSIVTTTLGSYDPAEWRFRHGPGAIAEATGPTNKYYWSNWSDTLEFEYPIAMCGFHNYSSWADRCGSRADVLSLEPSSRLVAVPKTYSAPRLIAAEPSEHQWCQQNLWHYFCSRAERSWIGQFVRFRDQTLNQDLCTHGSLDGSLATLDLSEASDRVTCHVVGQYFRSNPKLLSCLRSSRTRSCIQNLTPNAPEKVYLRKFSTMGSACTFPVESLVFLGIAIAAVLTVRRLRPTLRNIRNLIGEVAVFGDDIVIPSDSRELFVDSLEVLYFKVNTNKSFWTERFRESCGVDSFAGVNVTPAYWKEFYNGGPESLASVVECSNNYYKKWLLNTSSYLASTLPKQIAKVAMSSGVFGLKSRLPVENNVPQRYNSDLQRDEIRVVSLLAKQTKSPTDDDTALLQYFTEDPDPFSKWTHGVAQRPRLLTKLRWVPAHDVTAK